MSKPKLDIPVAIHEKILPIFKDLAKHDLLEKCLHGKTQNVNQSLNGLIWQRCPKTIFSGRKIVEIAASAVIHFNDGPSELAGTILSAADSIRIMCF